MAVKENVQQVIIIILLRVAVGRHISLTYPLDACK
jgi:hypothetical protein